jgi:hypothetical protein
MRGPSLAPDKLDAAPSLNCWSFHEGRLASGSAGLRAHGWLCGHPTIPCGFHMTDFVIGRDFQDHRWVETQSGFYRLLSPLFDTLPLVAVFRWPKK